MEGHKKSYQASCAAYGVIRTITLRPTPGLSSKGFGLYGAQVESNMLNYDLTPAKWASGNSTMRFSVEN